MPTLPPDAHARIERVLATAELAVSAIVQQPPAVDPDGDGGYTYRGGQSPTDLIRAKAVAALESIVAVVTALDDRTAQDRRDAVEYYSDVLLTRHAIPRAVWLEMIRTQAWWRDFQQALASAESSPPRSRRRTDRRSFSEQLNALMLEARWTSKALAEATNERARALNLERGTHQAGLNEDTIDALRREGSRTPRLATVATLEDILALQLNRKITFHVPRTRRRPQRKKTTQTPVKRR